MIIHSNRHAAIAPTADVRGDGQGHGRHAAFKTEENVAGDGEPCIAWLPAPAAVVMGFYTPPQRFTAPEFEVEEASHAASRR